MNKNNVSKDYLKLHSEFTVYSDFCVSYNSVCYYITLVNSVNHLSISITESVYDYFLNFKLPFSVMLTFYRSLIVKDTMFNLK